MHYPSLHHCLTRRGAGTRQESGSRLNPHWNVIQGHWNCQCECRGQEVRPKGHSFPASWPARASEEEETRSREDPARAGSLFWGRAGCWLLFALSSSLTTPSKLHPADKVLGDSISLSVPRKGHANCAGRLQCPETTPPTPLQLLILCANSRPCVGMPARAPIHLITSSFCCGFKHSPVSWEQRALRGEWCCMSVCV